MEDFFQGAYKREKNNPISLKLLKPDNYASSKGKKLKYFALTDKRLDDEDYKAFANELYKSKFGDNFTFLQSSN